MSEQDNEERRAYMRWSVGSPVAVVVDADRVDCRLKDISAGGAGVDVELPDELGTQLSLQLSEARSVDARLVRVTARGSGLEFLVDDAIKAEFTEYIINGIDPADW